MYVYVYACMYECMCLCAEKDLGGELIGDTKLISRKIIVFKFVKKLIVKTIGKCI